MNTFVEHRALELLGRAMSAIMKGYPHGGLHVWWSASQWLAGY